MKRSHGAHPESAIKPNPAVNQKPNPRAAVQPPPQQQPTRSPLDTINSRVPRQADDGDGDDCLDDDCSLDDLDVPFFN